MLLRPTFHAAALAAAFLSLVGCVSAPRTQPTEGDFPARTIPTIEPVAPPESSTLDDKTSPTNTVAVVAPDPVATPKPWKVHLTNGSRKAELDGVTVWMSEPAAYDDEKTLCVSAADQRASLAPLLQAGTNPVVSGRPFRVFVDPGHGGDDSGALSYGGGYRESVHALDIARRLSTYLTRAGYEVRISRPDDTFIPLEDRPAIASAWRADAFVSLHLNSAPDAEARGLETFAMPPAGMRTTAQVDLAVLSAAAQATVRQSYPGNAHNAENLRLAFAIQRRLLKTTGYPDRGVRRARFAVLRDADMPAVLVEAGFLSNPADTAFLATPNGRERIARGIYQGIVDFATGHLAPGFPPAPVVPAAPTALVLP